MKRRSGRESRAPRAALADQDGGPHDNAAHRRRWQWFPKRWLSRGTLVLGAVLTIGLMWVVIQVVVFRTVAAYNIDLPPVAAFSDRYSYDSGDIVSLAVHSDREVTGSLHRLGLRKEQVGPEFVVGATAQPNRYDLKSGFDWSITHELATEGLDPGLYALELTTDGSSRSTFVVPIAIRSTGSPVAVILSTNTWDAYNAFGGVSNYENRFLGSVANRALTEIKYFGGTAPDVNLPSSRPNGAISDDLLGQVDPTADYSSRLARHEWTFLAFLETNGIDYDVFSASDFAFGTGWEGARVVVFPGHSEYWTQEMFYSFERFIAFGGHAIVSAGNPMLKPAIKTRNGLRIPQLEHDPTVIHERVGVSYTRAGFSTAAAYEVLVADHWIFAGTSLSAGDVFGQSSATKIQGLEGDGASGIFTLSPGAGSGEFQLLARGLNADGPANMVYRDTDSGGWIFNSGSGSFTGSLARDDVAKTVVLNLLRNALAPSS